MPSALPVHFGPVPGARGTRMSWLVDVKRQVVGSGFQTDPDLTSKMTRAERQTLSRVSAGFTQLGVDMSTQPRALHSTTFVFDGGTGRWGAVVVGSGGEYGETGAIQTVLAPEGLSLVDVARWVLGALSYGPLLSPEVFSGDGKHLIARDSTSRVDPGALAQTLTVMLGMSQEQRYTLLNVQGAQGEQALMALMRTVPEDLARLVRWSTAYPHGDRNRNNKIVTCLWPEELAQRHPDEYKSATSRIPPMPAVVKAPMNLDWYAQQICQGRTATDIRQKAEEEYRAKLNGIDLDASQWESATQAWGEVLEDMRPLADDELVWVLNSETPPSVFKRWDDNATLRLLRLQPGCLQQLLTHPHKTVHDSAWKVVLKERSFYTDLVTWQVEAVRMGRSAPPEAAGSTWCTSLAKDVLDEVKNQAPASEWGPRAEHWLQSLGLDPREYEDSLPLWQDKVVNRFKRDPARVDELLSYAQTASDGAGTLIKAAQQVPESLGFLLPRLWREPVAGVTWDALLDSTLRSKATPDRIIEILRFIDNAAPLSRSPMPSTGTAQSQTRRGDIYDVAPENSIPIELRRDIVAHFMNSVSPLALGEVANALLAFEHALPLPSARPIPSTPPAVRGKPSLAFAPTIQPQRRDRRGTALQPPNAPNGGQTSHSFSSEDSVWPLRVSLGLNAVLLFTVLILIFL